MGNNICYEAQFDSENWKRHFIFDALVYDGKGSESPVSLMPLLFMFLYSRNQLKLIRNINESFKDYDVLHFVDYRDVMNDFDFENFSFSHAELEDFAHDTRDKALISIMEENDPLYETVAFIIEMKNQYLEIDRKPYKEYWQGFDFYDLLNEVSPEFIKDNYSCLFTEIIKQNKFLHKIFMNSSFLKTQKSHFELARLMIQLLDIKEGSVVVQPFADFGYTLSALPFEVSYFASYETPLAMHLVRLFGAGSNVVSVVATMNTVQYSVFDYLLWNPLLHMKKEASDYMDLFHKIVEHSHREIKAACLIPSTFWLYKSNIAECCLSKHVHKIIFFRNSFTLALFDSEIRERERRIVIVDETAALSISADDILQHLNERKFQYVLTDGNLRKDGYTLDINAIVRRHQKIKPIKGKRMVCIGQFLKEQRLKQVVFWKTKEQGGVDCKSNRDFYTFYMPFVSAENSQTVSDELFFEMKKKNVMALELEKRVLFVNLSDRHRFQPRIFDDSKGKAVLYFNRYDKIAAFEVDESIVDVEYLVCEMNKEYFQNQLYPTRGYCMNDVDSFLSLYIQIPDCETSVERQKNLFRAEKLEYIKSLIKTLGYDIEKIVANKERAPLPNGTMLLNGKYRIDAFLNYGGFGKTYKATEFVQMEGKNRRMEVAIKEFFIDDCQRRYKGSLFVETPCEKIEIVNKAQKKFMDETKKIKKFSEHPNIVNVYDVFDENGTCYYTMEYIDGLTLEDYVESKETNALEESEAIRIVNEVASALDEMHKHHMNHLDVKPSNILIDDSGRAVLIDFGTAHTFDSQEGEQVFSCVSQEESSYFPIRSDGYSPLEIGSLVECSPATDVYSLAATLYRIVSGERVPTARELLYGCCRLQCPDNISSRTWHAIQIAMSPMAKDRPQNIKDFLELIISD